MRWGLIARSETDRGIGIQSYGMYQNLHPDRTLVIMNSKSGFDSHPELYPGATFITLEHGTHKNTLNEQIVRDWWAGLDVVIAVETFYDWDMINWAKADGVRTVVHGNPEFWMATNPQPDTWIWPTHWRLEHLPPGEVVPVPVPERPWTALAPDTDKLQVLHIAGNRAMGDRNGTDIVALAMKRVQAYRAKLTVYSQVPIPVINGSRLRAPVVDRWEMYENQHVLLMPRRYGGLCLPALEAMASGMAVMMSDCPPNTKWPIIPIHSEPGRVLHMQTGKVRTYDCAHNTVGDVINHVANNRTILESAMSRAREWAEANRWSQLADRYYQVLGRIPV